MAIQSGGRIDDKRGRIVKNNNPDVVSDVVSDVTSDVPILSPVQLSERQKKICKLIENNPKVSAKEMSLVLSLVLKTVKRDLAALQKMGVIIHEGKTSAGRWVLLTNIEEQ